MIGYGVTMADLDDRIVEGAAHYAVADDGSLRFTTDGREVETIGPGEWVEVHEVGTRLAITWPPDDLEYLMHDLAYLLGVGWGYTGRPATGEDVASEVFNNEEALLEAAFAAVRASLDDKRLRDEAVKVVRRCFRARSGRPAP